jgi:hypothetical protein
MLHIFAKSDSAGVRTYRNIELGCQQQDGQQLLLTFRVEESQTRKSALLTEIELTHYGP